MRTKTPILVGLAGLGLLLGSCHPRKVPDAASGAPDFAFVTVTTAPTGSHVASVRDFWNGAEDSQPVYIMLSAGSTLPKDYDLSFAVRAGRAYLVDSTDATDVTKTDSMAHWLSAPKELVLFGQTDLPGLGSAIASLYPDSVLKWAASQGDSLRAITRVAVEISSSAMSRRHELRIEIPE